MYDPVSLRWYYPGNSNMRNGLSQGYWKKETQGAKSNAALSSVTDNKNGKEKEAMKGLLKAELVDLATLIKYMR